MNRIKEIRERNGLKQSDLAKKMNCTTTSISRYESGEREIDSETINRICDIFNVTSDYLLCRSDNPSPQISAEDLALLQAYHAAPDHIRAAADSMLQLDTQKESPPSPEARAAG